MTEMRKLFDRLQDGNRDESIIKDLKREGVSNVYSEESKRKLKRDGQHRALRTYRNSQNNSVSYMPAT